MKINKKYEESIYDNVLPATGTSTLIYSGTGEFDKESLESLATYISHSLSASG